MDDTEICRNREWVPKFLRSQKHLIGCVMSNGIQILNEPIWQASTGKWNCLANVVGMLCVVEITIHE